MWLLLLMLSSGGYNISSVNRAISEYRIRPITYRLNLFAKSKIHMEDTYSVFAPEA